MSKSATTYEAIDGRIAPESITEDTMSGLEIVDGHAVKAPGDYEDPDRLYDMLIARIRKYHPSTDVSMIEKAYRMAKEAHGEQVQKIRRALHYSSFVGFYYPGGSGAG